MAHVVGEFMKDMIIQKAYGSLRKRGFKYPLNTCYHTLMGILDREGENGLNEYVKKLNIR